MEGAHEDSVWSRTKADRKNGEDIWKASDGQKANHQAKYGMKQNEKKKGEESGK